jgi:hypothetical protein
MQHLVAYFESLAASLTDSDQAAELGQGDFVTNAHHVLPQDRWLVAAYNSGLGNTQARIDAPSLRQVAPVQIRPLTRALLPPTDPNIADYRRRPIRLTRDEEIRILVTTDATVGPNNTYTGLWTHDGNFSVSEGPEYIIRATGTTTLVAGDFTLVALTYQDQLPRGSYDIVGFEALGATAIFSRIVSVGSQIWRAGTLGQLNEGTRTWLGFYGPSQGLDNYGMGSFGQFSTVFMPSVEYLANAADTAQTVFLRCRKFS